MLHFLLSAVIIPLIVSVTTTLIVLKVALKKGYTKESLSSSHSHTSSQSRGLFYRFKTCFSRKHTKESNPKTPSIKETSCKCNQSKDSNHLDGKSKNQIEKMRKDIAREKKDEYSTPKKDEGSNDRSLMMTGQSNKTHTTQKSFTTTNEKLNNEGIGSKHYTLLAVFQGRLVEDPDKTTYYRAWEEKGLIHYEFYCEDDVMLKAINNHSPLIDSFCDKENGSVDYENATSIVNVKSGILSSDNTISKKAIIKYV